MSDEKYRLVTRSDFDGLVCAMLLKELGIIDEIKFVHPKDMQDGKIEITNRDITTNLPYVASAHLVFDHHSSELVRNPGEHKNLIIDGHAPSAARVVYNYYGGKKTFPHVSDELMEAVNKADAAQFTIDEILNPTGWALLSFIMDSRTGLGRFHHFRISNYTLMMALIDICAKMPINEILALPDVKERVETYKTQEQEAIAQMLRCTKQYKNLVVLDLRKEEVMYATNRFLIYAMFPQCNISIHAMRGLKNQNVVFATGKSIIDRSSKTNIGQLMLKYGGGGHNSAGTCQIPIPDADRVLQELVEQITKDG